jgi:hypothetical protein
VARRNADLRGQRVARHAAEIAFHDDCMEVRSVLVVSEPIALKAGIGASTYRAADCASKHSVGAGSSDAFQLRRKVCSDEWVSAQLGRLVKMAK